MSDESELTITKALQDGIANNHIVELTQAHCTHAEFVRFGGGRGLVEALYGVPIGHHLMQCHRARSNTAAYHIEDVAVGFYRDNCVGCPDRNMVGLPNLATYVAELDRVRDQASERRLRLLDSRKSEWTARQARRDAVHLAATDQATRSIIDDISVLDVPPESPHSEKGRVDQALKRLEDTAQVAPELYDAAVVDVLVEVARLGTASPFRVLRILLHRGVIDVASVVPLAFDHLNTGHGHESAASCLVDSGDAFTSAHVSPGVIKSAVSLAGRFLSGPFQRVAVQHPALLLACFERAPDAVVTEVTHLLGGRRRPRTLLLPQGETHLVDSDNDNHRRAEAANATAHLLNGEVAVDRFVPVLVRALDIPDADSYNSRPSSRITHTLAKALLARPSQVAAHVERLAPALGASGRKRLFAVYEQALRLAQGDVTGWVDVEEDVEIEGGTPAGSVGVAARDVIVSQVLEHLRGDWGDEVAADSAEALTEVLRVWPDALDMSIETLLGHVLHYADAPLRPSPVIDPLSFPLERMTASTNRASLLSRVSEALEQIATRKRSEVLRPVLAVLGGPRLEGEVDDDVRTRLVRLVGNIGGRPGALGDVVPTIYTAVLSRDPLLRKAGIHAWAAVESRGSRMPSTFDEVLAEALRTETTVGPLRALLEHLPRLCRTDELRKAVVLQLVGILRALDGGDEHNLLELTVNAAAALSRRLDPKLRSRIELLCLSYTARLPDFKRKSFLSRSWSAATRATSTYAELVLTLLSHPNVVADVNDQGGRESERVELRNNAGAIVDVAYETIASAARTALEHRLTVAPYYVELLGAAGRWAEALQLALELHNLVPDIPRMNSARTLTRTALTAALLANAAAYSFEDFRRELDQAATTVSEDDDGRVLNTAVHAWVSVANKLLDGADQLLKADRHDLRRWSEWLDRHAALVRAKPPFGPEWSAWVDLVDLAAALLKWDFVVRSGGDAQGALATAARLAEGATARAKASSATPAGDVLIELAETATSGLELQDLPGWLQRLATVPLPAPVLGKREARPRPPGRARTPQKLSRTSVKPTAVCLPAVDGIPATWVQVLRRDRIYDLSVEIRLPEWPDWGESLDVELVSAFPSDLLQLPVFSFARPSPHLDGSFRVHGTGELLLRFDQAAGSSPRAARVLAWFRAEGGRAEQVDVAGYNEVLVRAHDETRDGLTERRVVDERLLQLFAAVPADVADEEVQAFARFFTAIVRQGVELQFDRGYKRGSRVRERDFHDDLERRLRADPALSGRLTRGDRAALGFVDLRHDGITAELKVERREAVQVETSHRYLGQPTQYATGGSKRLSILVILDMASSDAPVGVLSNYLGIMVPALRGLSDPTYPSLVGVVILNADNPIPSAWSSRKIDATSLD